MRRPRPPNAARPVLGLSRDCRAPRVNQALEYPEGRAAPQALRGTFRLKLAPFAAHFRYETHVRSAVTFTRDKQRRSRCLSGSTTDHHSPAQSSPAGGIYGRTFGPGLVAAGLNGYETGAGTRERADVRGQITRKKPKTHAGSGGGPPQMVYLEGLGRSVTLEVARALLGDLDTRARLICDDESCCPHGVDSMLDDRVRHTINARAHRMRDLNAMPQTAWRLHQVTREAEQAVRTTRRAARALRRAGINTRLDTGAQESLGRIAEHLRKQNAARQSA
jgi:hypothetical protein